MPGGRRWAPPTSPRAEAAVATGGTLGLASRMTAGGWVSAAGHAGLAAVTVWASQAWHVGLAAALLGGPWLMPEPLEEFEVTPVSMVSGTDYAALVARTSP